MDILTCDFVEAKPLDAIQKDMIAFTRNSGVKVKVENIIPTVDITSPTGSVFMQEEEASDYLENASYFWNHFDMSDEEALLLTAYEYLDCLG